MRIRSLTLCLLVCATARAQEEPLAPPSPEERLAPEPAPAAMPQLVFTSGVSGHFGDPSCDPQPRFEPGPFARHASSVRRAAESPGSFAFDTGGFFAPHGVGRFALEREPEALVTLVRELGYDALAFAVKDLQAERTPIVALARLLREAEIPWVASNLRCAGASARLCDAIDDAGDPVRVVPFGGESIAFLAFVDPAILSHVVEENRRELTLEPLLEAFHRRVAEARAAGATFVVASVDAGGGAQGSGAAIALAESLPEGDRPDLLVAARAGRELLFARPASFQPPIAAAPPGGAVRAEVRRREEVGFELFVRTLPPSPEPAAALVAMDDSLAPAYCAELGRPMPGGRLESPLDAAGFVDLTGGAMRVAADAEIALLNRSLVADGFRHDAASPLAASDVHLGIQFDEPLFVASVDGPWLQRLARAIAAHPEARAIGLTISDANAAGEAIAINGRPLDTRGRYRIVAPRFLASGGDELVPPGARWTRVENGPTIRSAILGWLEPERAIDPRLALPDPADRLEWSFSFASDASLGASRIANPGDYGDTQFDRVNSVIYGTENQLDLNARSSRLSWENQALLRYRATNAAGAPRAEADDLISYRTTFAYRKPRIRHPEWWMPEPYAETYVETEFTVPAARSARHFLVRPTGGARFTLTRVLALKLQAGGAFELFDRSVAPSPGVGGVLTLTSWKFFEAGRRNGAMDGTFDWFVSGLGVSAVHTLRGNFNVAIQLNQVLGISFTSTLFAVKHVDDAFAYALSTTANLRLRWYVRTQR